eukprot:jgi/Bigna1/79552/fgenesh1_pg.63_\
MASRKLRGKWREGCENHLPSPLVLVVLALVVCYVQVPNLPNSNGHPRLSASASGAGGVVKSHRSFVPALPSTRVLRARRKRRGTVWIPSLNRLLFESDEINIDDDEGGAAGTSYFVDLPMDDYRAVHVKDILGTESGEEVRVGVVDAGKCDNATVQWRESGLRIDLSPGGEGGELAQSLLQKVDDRDRPDVELLLALPRPRVFERLLPVIAQSGVRKLFVAGSAKVDTSYWSTHMLNPTHTRHKDGLLKMREKLKEGLTQSGDTALPTVRIVRNLEGFITSGEDIEKDFPKDRYIRLVSHPSRPEQQASIGLPLIKRLYELDMASLIDSQDKRVLLAVGPDGGWEEPWEVERFLEMGFIPFTLGERVLHTEVAVPVLVALLHDWLDRGKAALRKRD